MKKKTDEKTQTKIKRHNYNTLQDSEKLVLVSHHNCCLAWLGLLSSLG